MVKKFSTKLESLVAIYSVELACMDSTLNVTADGLANPNSAFVAGTENFCLDSIKSRGVMKVLNPS